MLSYQQIQTNPDPWIKIVWSLTSSGARYFDVEEKRKWKGSPTRPKIKIHQTREWVKQNDPHLVSPGRGFPGDSVVKNLLANAGNTGSVPDPGRPHMQ